MTPTTLPRARGVGALLLVVAGSIFIITASALIQIGAGSYDMTWRQALAAVTDGNVWSSPSVLSNLLLGKGLSASLGFTHEVTLPTTTLIVWNIRMPRVLVGVFVGINLSLSGTIFQAITRNEMASPYLLGVS